jgi:hypothetical protein
LKNNSRGWVLAGFRQKILPVTISLLTDQFEIAEASGLYIGIRVFDDL